MSTDGCCMGKVEELHAIGLGRIAPALMSSAKVAVQLITMPGEDSEMALGISRLGGLPDMPAEVIWPQWNGKPLSFIAQINLNEFQHFSSLNALPKQGLLSFFTMLSKRLGAMILHIQVPGRCFIV